VAGATPASSPTPTTSAKPAPPSTNISIGASASASKTFTGYRAEWGIDSSKGTSWFSKGPEPENGNTSTFTIKLKKVSTITRLEFWDNSTNNDRTVRNGFGFRKWRVDLYNALGTKLYTVKPTQNPLKSQKLSVPSIQGVVRAVFVGEGHEDKTCGGFSALWLFGYPTAQQPVG
jgi:hypothetical protein